MKHARKSQKKSFESTLNTALFFTLAPLWVLGEGVLRCIATALRGLAHQSRREVVRSDKFVEQYDNIIKSWVTWIMRAIYPGDPPWVESCCICDRKGRVSWFAGPTGLSKLHASTNVS